MTTVATRQKRKDLVQRKQKRIHLTPTGLLMEGVCTSLRRLFAFFGVNVRNGDVTTSDPSIQRTKRTLIIDLPVPRT
jgi:hypothetical protein